MVNGQVHQKVSGNKEQWKAGSSLVWGLNLRVVVCGIF